MARCGGFNREIMEQEQYIVSARKYRPDNFGTLIGQDNIARTLKNSIIRGQLAHAYLFCGPRGVGKTTTARIFAKMINCSNPSPEMEPCGECESCRSFAEGRSFCIHELDAASNNGVDAIKELMDQVRIPPQIGKYSVFIIDEVHMLSQSAFNAFLKTLEEPPAHAIFILATTEKHKILPTILSRCQTYDFNRISVGDIVRNLKSVAEKENVKIDEDSLHVIAAKADGAMRDALTIFDQTVAFCGTDVKYADVIRNLNVLDYEYTFSLVDCFLAGDWAKPFMIFDEILSKGFNALHFVSALSAHLRDLAVAKSGGLDALLEVPDRMRDRFREQASRCSMAFLYDALAITSACEAGYRTSANPRLHIEFALMRLSYIVAKPAAGQPLAQTVASARSQTITAATASETASAPASAAAVHPRETQVAAPKTSAPAASTSGEPAAVTATPSAASSAASSRTETPAASTSGEPAAVTSTPSAASSAASSRTETPAASTPGEPVAGASTPSAASSAAAPSGDPEPAASGNGRRRRTSSMSISNLEDTSAKSRKVDVRHELPSEEIIRAKWPELSGLYASKQRLASLLQSTKITIGDTPQGQRLVTFAVVNEAQKKWIEDQLLNSLEANLMALVHSDMLRLAVEVTPYEQTAAKEPYMPSEKARALIENNVAVRSLVKDMDLDIK